MQEKNTPLLDRHIELGGNMVTFGGYLLPTHYSGINVEHLTVRSKAGLFDVSHMGEFIISGSDAESFLQKVTVNDVASLSVGQAQYSAMCYANGGIIDDILVYKKKNEFMLVVNAANNEKDLDWLNSHAKGDIRIENMSDDIGLVAIQGPRSRNILQTLTDSNLTNIQFYHFVEGRLNGKKAIISRTGYTGELGFEIYANSDNIGEIWDAIMKAGQDKGLEPAGLGCRDTLRMEMKLALYGNDIDDTTNPIEAGLGWITRLGKTDFMGKKALLEAKPNVTRRLVCLEMTERAIPRQGCPILMNDESVGIITSGTMSPSLEIGIGIGYVNRPFDKSGTELLVDIRGRMKSAVVVKPPFYKNGSLMD
ncbi:MAG: glycine cleavage system aminomethyltransferase GcvT [Candidatus Marinimicrobia bacterium]|nr:glycine cleavage system aminomethyltransferase GcvT [Candidatus Neomarinimicrobiota bacterium]